MTKRATFTRDEIAAAASVAVEKGVAIVIERPDGNRITVTPQAPPAPLDADLIQWGPK